MIYNSQIFFTFAPIRLTSGEIRECCSKLNHIKIIMADLMKFVQDEIATKRFPSFSAGDTITVL
jgi:hypothetical protein